MDDEQVIDGQWPCKHEGGHATTLRETDALPQPPHYVICPDCGTHWICWTNHKHRRAGRRPAGEAGHRAE